LLSIDIGTAGSQYRIQYQQLIMVRAQCTPMAPVQ
jgi:hypothetical protein